MGKWVAAEVRVKQHKRMETKISEGRAKVLLLFGERKGPKYTLNETKFCIGAAISQTPTKWWDSEKEIDGFRRQKAIKKQRSIKSGELKCRGDYRCKSTAATLFVPHRNNQ